MVHIVRVVCCFFFFSSRRRHTRWTGDWSSDVCSSDLAERIRATVESTTWRWSGEAYPLTISCGVAAYPDTVRDLANLQGTADAALYAAKQGGRNRVERAQGDVTRYTG